MEANELVNADRRQSESPARTIDSLGSTVGSLETIVDRHEELMQITVDNSTNTTNLDNHNENSSTNSQISIITKDKANGDGLQQQQQDAQSHIYSSPVYMTMTEKPNEGVAENEVPKLITHAEFEKQQLTHAKLAAEMTKNSTATLDSKISKKQRFPPELIKIKGDSAKDFKVGRHNSFPNQVTLGVVQLLLSVALVALGAVLIVREASLAAVGSGIWTGGIAAITGALGVINMRKVQTGFLALSLVCIATSTLALAISGVGLIRDIQLDEKLMPTKLKYEKITAAYWLVFTLGLHCIVSVISVYKSALRLCSRPSHDECMYDNINNSGLPADHETIEEYIKAMSLSSGTINLLKKEQLASQLIYSSLKPGSVKDTMASRSIILIPASLGNALLPPPPPVQQSLTTMMRPPLGIPPPYPMLLPPGVTLPPVVPMVYRGGMTLPHKRPGRYSYGSYRSQMASIRHHRHRPHPQPACSNEINGRHSKPHRRTCKNDGSNGRHQRRKSDTDADNRKAFTYTGLDRQLADSFLARQEQTNGSHIDYTSSGESGRNECHDVVM